MHPERLGAFEISGVLGEGGSSIVYAAREGDRTVALKVLHPDAGLAAKDVEKFLEEAERMRRVSHANLVPVLGAGLLPGGRPFISMPLVPGRSLAERLGGAPLDIPRALALFRGLCHAVAAVHAAGLVHRDIKPENVVWPEDEERLVLLDLGIAREASGAPSTTTQAGLTRGTPAYMAPERFFGKQASVKSDVYELALVLFVMLVGRLPWDPDDPQGRLSPKIHTSSASACRRRCLRRSCGRSAWTSANVLARRSSSSTPSSAQPQTRATASRRARHRRAISRRTRRSS